MRWFLNVVWPRLLAHLVVSRRKTIIAFQASFLWALLLRTGGEIIPLRSNAAPGTFLVTADVALDLPTP